MQLLESGHIVNGPNPVDQLLRRVRIKAKGQHFLDTLLNALLGERY